MDSTLNKIFQASIFTRYLGSISIASFLYEKNYIFLDSAGFIVLNSQTLWLLKNVHGG